ncbi:hypothetical protein COT98_03375 [Candidatus Falkowbacteria bacterium CG10_big_fil_rev_8_21_14_0_10_39_9]|uniref:Uncharacterized protein n=1 Tax=Candidatus Falkowbacteria bacterium CG10_big_fil_rev_8_21_14_0_10_39_9 TaxID=1974566 RepID=A0A2M6WP01_9BACT|nr:MAG: hypothetical protein COT98_03375 [Candidatus Falkowbacteria bacterium CG10_big_fil_rev_8_21_14_0_10_39_9]
MTIALFVNNTAFAQYPDDVYGSSSRIKNTQVYVGDPNTTEIQKKIDLIDAEILKLENKKEAELKSLEKSFKASQTKKKDKENKKAPKEVKKNKYSLVDQINSSNNSETDVSVTPTTNTVVEVPSPASDYEASKQAIVAKYNGLIDRYNQDKKNLIELMVNSKGNYIAANTNPYGATMIWANVNGGNNNNSTTTNNNINSSVQTTVLCLRNLSENWSIEITEGEFKGAKLWARKGALIASSFYCPVPIGNYTIKYIAYKNGGDKGINFQKNVSIYPGKPTIDFIP